MSSLEKKNWTPAGCRGLTDYRLNHCSDIFESIYSMYSIFFSWNMIQSFQKDWELCTLWKLALSVTWKRSQSKASKLGQYYWLPNQRVIGWNLEFGIRLVLDCPPNNVPAALNSSLNWYQKISKNLSSFWIILLTHPRRRKQRRHSALDVSKWGHAIENSWVHLFCAPEKKILVKTWASERYRESNFWGKNNIFLLTLFVCGKVITEKINVINTFIITRANQHFHSYKTLFFF